MAEATQYVQLNMRVDKLDKQRSEEVLHLMGTSITDLVRKVLAAVACGAKEYSAIEAALEGGSARQTDDSITVEASPVLVEGWAIGQAYLASRGIKAGEMCEVENDWSAYYEDAMLAKGLERGWLS